MRLLDLQQSMALLRKYQIPLAPGAFCRTEEETALAARKIGYPVVLKTTSAGHKTELGGVIVSIRDEPALRAAFRKLSGLAPSVMVQKMMEGKEVIIGVKNDPSFGPAIMFGLGGVFVELFKDVSFRLCPISTKEAGEMVQETKAYQVLTGFRGSRPVKMSALVRCLLCVSRFAVEEQVEEMDINPLIVSERGAWAVDARIVLSDK